MCAKMLRDITTNLNIRTKLVLLCLGVALPLLAIGCFSIVKQYSSLKDEAHRATSFQAAIAARSMSQWTELQVKGLSALANLPNIKKGDLGASRSIFQTALQAHTDWDELV